MRRWAMFLLGVTALAQAATCAAERENVAPLAKDLGRAGVPSGLIVVVGDAAQAQELARQGSYIVHLLLPAAEVPAAREKLFAAGVGGRVVVSPLLSPLVHPSRFVDAIVLPADAVDLPVPAEEWQRVLNVGGKLLMADADGYKISPRAAETEIDAWTHKWYAADGNNVSRDRVAAPPQTVQWAAGPSMADGAGGGKHPVIGGGLFAAVDNVDGAIVARSAGNGLARWRALAAMSPAADLLLTEDRLLARPADEKLASVAQRNARETGPLMGLDLVTGEPLLTYDLAPQMPLPTQRTFEPGFPATIAIGERLVVSAGRELAVLERKSGKRLWLRESTSGAWFMPRAIGETVVAVESPPDAAGRRGRFDGVAKVAAVQAFALADGKPLWRNEKIMRPSSGASQQWVLTLKPPVVADGKIFLHATSYQMKNPDAFLAALDLATGEELWRYALPEGDRKDRWGNTDSSACVVWLDGKLLYVGGHGRGGVATFDPNTGKLQGEFVPGPQGFAYGGECSMSRVTVNWIIKASCTWFDRDLQPTLRPAARSSCGAGTFPAQGMSFVTPTGCDCTHYVRGYLGMASDAPARKVADADRLVRGEAAAPAKFDVAAPSGAWTHFLAQPQRTATADDVCRLPRELEILWTAQVAPTPLAGPLLDELRRDEYWLGAISAPTIAGGAAFFGLAENTGGVIAVDLATGKPRWQSLTEGAIETPPTLARGLALAGGKDGWVYALRQDDGRLVWKFNAAPASRVALLSGRLSSAFPALAPTMAGDRLLASAGFHSYLGGVYVWSLDPATGQVLGKSAALGGAALESAGMVMNDIFTASATGEDFWIGGQLRVSAAAEPRAVPKRGFSTRLPESPAVYIERQAGQVRFTSLGRGGSTHGWKNMMAAGGASGYRVIPTAATNFVCHDPGSRFAKGAVLSATPVVAQGEKAAPRWQLDRAALDDIETVGSLALAGDRLIAAGGMHDGSRGKLWVISAADGRIEQSWDLPAAPVASGVAVAENKIVVSLVDGRAIALGDKP